MGHVNETEGRCLIGKEQERLLLLGNVDGYGLAVAEHVDLLGIANHAIHVGTHVLEFFLVGRHQNVTILKTNGFSLFVELHSLFHALERDVGLAPGEKHHRVDK